jgi:spore cortex formation protein SpoVR/YcgB (stage V sporulation)
MKNKRITAAHRRRFEIMKFEIGCIFHPRTPAECHHLLSGGNRISHDATVALCPVCHWDAHNNNRWFLNEHDTTDAQMLEETNRRVADFEATVVK